MSDAIQELNQIFPEDAERIYNMKMLDGNFAALAGRFDQLGHKIQRLAARKRSGYQESIDQMMAEREIIKEEIRTLLAG